MWQCLSGSCNRQVALPRRYPLDVQGWAVSPEDPARKDLPTHRSGGLSQSEMLPSGEPLTPEADLAQNSYPVGKPLDEKFVPASAFAATQVDEEVKFLITP